MKNIPPQPPTFKNHVAIQTSVFGGSVITELPKGLLVQIVLMLFFERQISRSHMHRHTQCANTKATTSYQPEYNTRQMNVFSLIWLYFLSP